MIDFPVHTLESAPEGSRPLLERSKQEYGMIPNLHGVMAESAAVLEGYRALNDLFTQRASFAPEEQTVIWLTVAVDNGCHYCVPAHTAIAKSMQVPDEISDALRTRSELPDGRLEALRKFTRSVVREHGSVSQQDIRMFMDAGYERRHVLEVVLGVAQKVLSNYVNAIAQTPLDQPFRKFDWQPPA